MKNILVATDFSNNAYNALYFAAQLFGKRQCSFTLLNAYTEQTRLLSQKVGVTGNFDLLDQLADESLEGLKQQYHRIRLDLDNPLHHFETISVHDHLTDAIQSTIENKQVDLLVIGNSGKTKTSGLRWGSNAQKLIKEIRSCPILAVPLELEFNLPKEIAFATDYNHTYDAELLHPLIQIATMSNATVCIMHVNEEDRLSNVQKSNLYTLREYLSNIRHSVHWMPDYSSRTNVIKTFLEELNIDMLSMVQYEHGFFEALTREPVIKNLCLELNIPLLLVPYRA